MFAGHIKVLGGPHVALVPDVAQACSNTMYVRDRDVHKQRKFQGRWKEGRPLFQRNQTAFFYFSFALSSHLGLEFTKKLRPQPFASTLNTLAGIHSYTHSDKLDWFIHNLFYN